jgi:cysteine desulfurase
MGVEETLAEASIRFGLGRFTTADDIEHAADALLVAVQEQRRRSPEYEMR